jgi:hypothetical protein
MKHITCTHDREYVELTFVDRQHLAVWYFRERGMPYAYIPLLSQMTEVDAANYNVLGKAREMPRIGHDGAIFIDLDPTLREHIEDFRGRNPDDLASSFVGIWLSHSDASAGVNSISKCDVFWRLSAHVTLYEVIPGRMWMAVIIPFVGWPPAHASACWSFRATIAPSSNVGLIA